MMVEKLYCDDKFTNMIKALSEGLSVADINFIRLISSISAKITASRIERKMNQTEFAKFMGVAPHLISKWERGDYNFTIKQLCEICDKLDIKVNINLGDEQ